MTRRPGSLSAKTELFYTISIFDTQLLLLLLFPFWRDMDKSCWNNYVVSLESSVTMVTRLPISWVSSIAMLCHVPAVSLYYFLSSVLHM